MCQSDTQLIEVQYTYAHINSNAKMLSGAGNTYFAADVKAKGLNLYLFQCFVPATAPAPT